MAAHVQNKKDASIDLQMKVALQQMKMAYNNSPKPIVSILFINWLWVNLHE